MQRIFWVFVLFYQKCKSRLSPPHEAVYTVFPYSCPHIFSFHKHPLTFYHTFTYIQTYMSLTLLFYRTLSNLWVGDLAHA